MNHSDTINPMDSLKTIFQKIPQKRWLAYGVITIVALLLASFWASARLTSDLVAVYKNRESAVWRERLGEIIAVRPNNLDHYAVYTSEVPPHFAELLLKKEDRYFHYHPGVNPVSIVRGLYRLIAGEHNSAASTITQQLVKILRAAESERTLSNKIIETVYALALEMRLPKEKILEMYVNSVYFGNRAQGLAAASRLYFDSPPDGLNDWQIGQLLATISSPSLSHPFAADNQKQTSRLLARLSISAEEMPPISRPEMRRRQESFNDYANTDNIFEFANLAVNCREYTIDGSLTRTARDSVARMTQALAGKGASHAAVVVIKLPENELLAVVGSPEPTSPAPGYQLNMATAPRPIGSTIKPFIYLKGFERGLRPYTLVEDREYKYLIESGFAFYPKNYDYRYRGQMNLHYALANSLNVPTVKVLEYVGLEKFYDFLLQDLAFRPIQPLPSYQLGIALGGLEMDLLTLSYYFTLFPQEGVLKPLALCRDKPLEFGRQTSFRQQKTIAPKEYVQLVNKILIDRQTGAEQFGLKSNLNVTGAEVAAKTGTSREFHDSWAIGYTPDFVVGVWVGNAANLPMEAVSGEQGAGRVWREVMQLLLDSEYNHHTPFRFYQIKNYQDNGNLEWGLTTDNYQKQQDLLSANELILSPHAGDIFLLEDATGIPMRARRSVGWSVNSKTIGEGEEVIFHPKKSGRYRITAGAKNGQSEQIDITVAPPEDE